MEIDMNMVIILLGILVIQMFVLISRIKKQNLLTAELSVHKHNIDTEIKTELVLIRRVLEE